ncbi:hypothetical protein PENARI_c002G04917 [Penicillium arizonense]|uniref:Uncharacterized protein n=1 Tax=Penicillium arizonense TaxID=1835702 RepID=A0A1F5LVW6_PENAI|nr:hypothetical protein PENARI_c002G04917 [Penicillium arizonense]OGE57109.1 hypothetical protein PENARI_c002G04917 [Penicillium arizonense]
MASSNREPIAVVGIGCRLPGGVTTTQDFWDTLCRGMNMVSEVPNDRFHAESLHDADSGKYGTIRSSKGGFIDDIQSFDAEYFGYYPAEASRMDPQQRLALEASVHALEDSGTTLEQVAGSQTSVFIGTFMSDHLCIQTATGQRDNISPHVAMGASGCSIANRVSHRLNIHGPSITLDTACSGSLVALHLACQSLWTQESEAALAGGVNVILRPETTILMSKAGFLSPDGSCKSFDAAANGYVRSEGVGMVFLKPLSRAIQNRDRIYALVRSSLVNQDGYTAEGFTVPSLMAQAALLHSVYAQSGIDPAKIRYVEAHGPGTSVGDPIEANALGKQLGQVRSEDEDSLWIGSAKGNFGHLEGAAGIVGFIKAALVTFYRKIPPQANYKSPNPGIDFQSLRLAVPTEMITLTPGRQHKLWVGVNSFGAGGTNAHAVLEEAPDDAGSSPPPSGHGPRVFVLSARSLSAMEQSARELASHLRDQKPALEDVAYTLTMRRSSHNKISVIPAEGLEDLCSKLDLLGARQETKDILSVQRRSGSSPKTAFLFSGQGGQWLGMGMALVEQEPVFRESLAAFDDIFTALGGFSIRAEISPDGNDLARLNKTTIVQPAIAAIQIALARLLISYGITPNAIVGYSIGEVAAAHIAGALSLEEAVKVIYFRSQIQSQAAGAGTMLATGISSEAAEQLIHRHQLGGFVEIAALNGANLTILSGSTTELEQLASVLKTQGTFARFVKVDVPYHSRFMDPFENDLVEALSSIQGKQTDVDLYSTVTTLVESGTHLTAKYWFQNVRKPVRFVETAARMLEDGCNFLVEIGPHPVLVSGIRGIAESAKQAVHIFPAMVRGSETEPVSCLIGAANAIGINADLHSFNGCGGRFVDLPLYPFQRQHYSFEHPEAQEHRLRKCNHPFLGSCTRLTDESRGTVRLRLSTGVSPFLADHFVDGAVVFPMTGHVESAYLAAREHLPHKKVWLEDLRFEHPVILASAEDFAPQVLLEITSPANDFVISSRLADSTPEAEWQVCSRGRINAFDQRSETVPEALDSVRSRVQTGTEVDCETFYQKIEESGLRYGEAFRGVRKIWRRGGEIFAYVKLPSSLHAEAASFRFHPAFLDSCLHTVYADLHHHGDSRYVYLPYHIEQVEIFEAGSVTAAFVHIQMKRHDDVFLCCDALIYGESGQVLAVATGITAKRIPGLHVPRLLERRVCFRPETQEGSSSIEAEFENVLILEPQRGDFDWQSVVQRTFPRAKIHQRLLELIDVPWKPAEWGFHLDRRVLVIVPAFMSGSHCRDFRSTVGVVMRALLRVATWLHETQGIPSLVIVTKGGCITPADSQCDPLSSSVEAAVRVMANELPRVRIRCVDLALDKYDRPIPLFEEELRTSRLGFCESVVAIRPEGRFFKRIVTVDAEEEEKRTKKQLPAKGGQYFSESDPNGTLDNITLRQKPQEILGPDDVGIEVHAAGVNFKDIMNGLGLLSERAVSGGLAGRNLGLEVAGQVATIGENVRDITIGTPVMARVSNGFGGFVTAHRNLLVPIPSSLTFPQAACIPGAFTTAYYALAYLGRLVAGESVLIHSAAGGVGIAAIQVAKHLGARVYATAGSPTRRAWVSSMGVEAVFDSRSVLFHDQLKAATRGQGVDVVLNSLTGAMFLQSVACLAPFGRFLEIGKTDIYRNMRLGLEQFGQNRSFFAIDVDRLATQKPDLHRQILNEVCALLESGKLVPLPITTYPITELSTALKALSRSAVIGKVAVEMPENTDVHAAPPSQLKLRSDRTYLITGGASGLGLHLARLLIERGAQYVILVSRSGPKFEEDHALLLDLRRRGAKVMVEQADVSSLEVVTLLFSPQTDWPPIVGVVHCAGVLKDSYSHDITMDDFWQVFAPKALGAWNLHLATQHMDLDFFVLVSSLSSILGLPGQFSYAAANQFLDGLAHHRRASGLPGFSLNLGILGDFAGMSRKFARNDGVLEILQSSGLLPVSLPTILSAFERGILHNATQRLAASIDWTMFFTAYPHLTRDGAFLGLENQQAKMGSSGSTRSMSNITGPERVKMIADILCSGLAKILGIEPSRISVTEKIDQYAIDSLTLTQLRSVILREIRVTYPLMRLYEAPSLQEIAVELNGSFQRGSPENQNITDVANHMPEQVVPAGLSILSKWFIRGNSANQSRPRLVCFHSMGVGASLFTPFLMNPPDGLDPIAVQLPGRENRANEAVPTTVSEVVSGILAEMDQVIGTAHIFWGHSFGGIVAFEVLRALRRQGKPLPRLLITGTIAPQLIRLWQKRDVMLQSFREDYSPEYLMAVSRYQLSEEDPLDVPITAFAARQDDVVYPDEVAAWSTHAREFNFIEVDGDHWFIHRNRQVLRETLVALVD